MIHGRAGRASAPGRRGLIFSLDPMKTLLTTIALAAALGAGATDFGTAFSDSTLRVDYVMGGSPDGGRVVLLKDQQKSPGWAGRRHNLDRVPAHGNGQVAVIDQASGDTIYRQSFNTLYQEWLVSEEAKTTPRAWDNVVLVPLPRRKAIIDVTLYDGYLKPMSHASHVYDPADILVRVTDKTPPEHIYMHRGAVENPIDVAIIGEGYTVAERDSFYRHAQQAVGSILSYEPFKSRKDAFNFVAVWTPSKTSGVSVPKNRDWKDTPYSSHFSTFYADRYLTSNQLGAMHDALRGIPYEHIIVLANVEEYGGGGFYDSNALTAARNSLFLPVVAHEFGHSFAALADEYFYDDDMADTYPDGVEPWEANITTLTDFGSKWADMAPQGAASKPVTTRTKQSDNVEQVVGVYEGAGYRSHGAYRPVDWCLMRSNLYQFCPVCQRAINRMIDFYM